VSRETPPCDGGKRNADERRISRADDLPAVIPVFPLPGALLLPRADALSIFEPRYLAMIDDSLRDVTG
jgi:Lon protease-like protein